MFQIGVLFLNVHKQLVVDPVEIAIVVRDPRPHTTTQQGKHFAAPPQLAIDVCLKD